MGRPKAAPADDAPHALLAQLLQELRKKAGQTYRQMAARTGVSHVTLSRADNGEALPSWRTVQTYLTACDASAEDARRIRRAWIDASDRPPAEPGPTRGRPAPHRPQLQLVTTPVELLNAIRHLHTLAGAPSLRTLEDRARRLGTSLPRSTLGDVLNGKRTPRHELLLAFVRACLVSCTVGGDYAHPGLWSEAWRRVRGVRPLPRVAALSDQLRVATARCEQLIEEHVATADRMREHVQRFEAFVASGEDSFEKEYEFREAVSYMSGQARYIDYQLAFLNEQMKALRRRGARLSDVMLRMGGTVAA